ncbi:uncharacterized protein LOC144719365 isoform X1 [Lampetra planeri]
MQCHSVCVYIYVYTRTRVDKCYPNSPPYICIEYCTCKNTNNNVLYAVKPHCLLKLSFEEDPVLGCSSRGTVTACAALSLLSYCLPSRLHKPPLYFAIADISAGVSASRPPHTQKLTETPLGGPDGGFQIRDNEAGRRSSPWPPHCSPSLASFSSGRGVSEYLCTEISTSKQKKFSLVTFIDTPGLVDGDMKYPFDVDKALLGLGELSDLLFVFFDPMGQALCKRTLNIVERLNENHGDKIRFYLSKADEAGSESDRQRVMMQIVQELCKRPGLNKCGFDMPTIYIPNPNKPSRCVNQIEEVCKSIEKTINQTIQNTLNTLEKDCELIASTIDRKLHNDREASRHNRTARCKGLLLGILSLALPTMLFANFLLASVGQEVLASVLGRETLETVRVGLAPLAVIWDWIHEENHTFFILGVVVFSLILLFIAKYICRSQVTLSSRERRQLEEKRTYVQTVVKQKKRKLYEDYLRQSVADHDMD